MKKVLIISLAYFPFVGGAEIAIREVMTRLQGEYEFKVVTARMKSLPKREVLDGISVRRLGFGIQSIDKLLFLPLAIIYSLFHRYDIVFGLLENQAALAAMLIAFLKAKPCIINLQSGDTEEYMKAKLGVLYFLYNAVYAKRPRYVVLSKYLKERAISHGVPQENITVIPNGVDTKTFACVKPKTSSSTIITASRLTLKNAIDDIIRALPIIKKSIPKANLIICGAGDDEQKLRALASELGVQSDITFEGLVPYKELPSKLCKADVFVRPSLSEGFGNSFIEALSCGLPIVGTNVGGIPDFLEHEKTGLICNVRDPSDLAKQVVRLLKDKKLAKKIVINGQKMIRERYEWDLIAKQFAEVLR